MNAHDRTIFISLKVIIFLKIGCANLDAAPISSLLPYLRILVRQSIKTENFEPKNLGFICEFL